MWLYALRVPLVVAICSSALTAAAATLPPGFTETQQELERILPVAEEIQSRELAALARMRNGDSLPDLLNFDEHWEAVARQADSKLVFLPI